MHLGCTDVWEIEIPDYFTGLCACMTTIYAVLHADRLDFEVERDEAEYKALV